MKSPKFYLREGELKSVINAERLEFTWRNKLRAAMNRQFVPDPLEHLDVHSNIHSYCRDIEALVFKGQYTPLSPNRFLAEKSKGLCRQMVIPHVRDALILQCLSDALWHDLKKKAPTTKSYFEPQDNSFAAADRRHEYGPFFAWLRFQKEIFRFSRERKFMVLTDIANYYDFIRYDHLRNTISSIATVRESVLDFLIYVLSELLWQPDYMPRIEIGLPQLNFDAPRILAHCFLYELDQVVCGMKDTDYVRFMDDIDVGVDSIEAAKIIIREIDLTLQSRHVRLNSGKTLILTAPQAARHFKVRENAFLDVVDQKLKTKTPKVLRRLKRKLPDLLSMAFRTKRFDDGNGDKILKRSIRIASVLRIGIKEEFLKDVLYRRPSCRVSIFRWFAAMPYRLRRFDIFAEFIRSGHVVDDSSVVEFARAVVDSRIRGVPTARSQIVSLCSDIFGIGRYGAYASMWMLSKYGTTTEVVDGVERCIDAMRSDAFLARLVGGVAPRFIASSLKPTYSRLVMATRNQFAIDSMNFHTMLSHDAPLVRSIERVIAAPNPSLPNAITHSKFLLLMSVCKNSSHPASLISRILRQHVEFRSDQFYSTLLP